MKELGISALCGVAVFLLLFLAPKFALWAYSIQNDFNSFGTILLLYLSILAGGIVAILVYAWSNK